MLVVPDFVCGLRHHVLHMPGPGRPPGRDHTAARLRAPLPPEVHLPVAPRRAALPAVQRQHITVINVGHVVAIIIAPHNLELPRNMFP